MEYKEMELSALEERKAQIVVDSEVEGADTDALLEEMRTINAEIESRKAEQAKKEELRTLVNEGAGVVIVEERKEQTKMAFTVDSKEYRNAWLKDLQGNELTPEERAGYAQTGNYATNAIPTLVADKFFEKMKKLAPMMNEITLMRVAGNLKFVVEDVRNTAGKHTENDTITVYGDKTIAVTLGAYEFAKIIGISKSAKMMSVDMFEEWLVEMLTGDIARAIDNFILNDSSNGICKGTFTTNTNQILNTSATYTWDNVMDLIALLPASYDADAKFVMNKKTLYGQIAKIVNSSKTPLFVQDTEGGFVGRIMGYPVLLDDYVATTNNGVYLGDFKQVVGNLSEGISVESNDVAGFKEAQVLYRGYASFDSKVANAEAIVRLVSTTA